MNLKKGGSKEEVAVQYSIVSKESKGEILVSRCNRKSGPEKILISNVQRSRVKAGNQEPHLRPSIPKHITTVDEKYLLHCLELIHRCAARASSTWYFSSKARTLPYDLSSLTQGKIRDSHDMTRRLLIKFPLVAGADVIISDWNIGTGSVSVGHNVINILGSPLFKQFGSTDFRTNYGQTGLHDIREPVHNAFYGPLHQVSYSLSHKPRNEAIVTNHNRSICAPGHVGSVSSTSSSSSRKSPSSASASSSRGTLRCTWKDGLPHHVFSVDDKRETYWSNVVKVESLDDKALDYVYTFYAGKQGRRELLAQELESIATMRVSKSITLCSGNKEVSEAQFILSVSNEDQNEELNPNHAHKKNKRFARKVANVFRPRHSSKHGTIFEETHSEISEDIYDPGEGKPHAPNLEVAAIIVKKIRSYSDLGGWGLKFLKKSTNDVVSFEKPESSENSRNGSGCSTSMNVLIPAALHGGPKTKPGGPSHLTERWISGGGCDCGGWDIGCPLTILVPRYNSLDSSPSEDSSGENYPFQLFIQGSRQDSPVLKMVKVHEGLYDIYFQSTLSSLQSFAIAAAIIHSQDPRLQSRVRER